MRDIAQDSPFKPAAFQAVLSETDSTLRTLQRFECFNPARLRIPFWPVPYCLARSLQYLPIIGASVPESRFLALRPGSVRGSAALTCGKASSLERRPGRLSESGRAPSFPFLLFFWTPVAEKANAFLYFRLNTTAAVASSSGFFPASIALGYTNGGPDGPRWCGSETLSYSPVATL